MKRLLSITVAVVFFGLVVSAPATANQPGAKWIKFPTCTATATSLTCTGSAVNVRDPYALETVVWALVNYTCVENGFVDPSLESALGEMKKGKAFTLTLVPLGFPTDPNTSVVCPSENWTRTDLNYYLVQVGAGIPLGGPEYPLLVANLDTISP